MVYYLMSWASLNFVPEKQFIQNKQGYGDRSNKFQFDWPDGLLSW